LTILGGVATTVTVAAVLTSVGVQPAFAGSVRVGPGETLSSIAARYHTTVAALASANGITNPDLVFAGAVLQIPQPNSSGSVRVQPGQTLFSIARAHRTTVSALAAANDITNLNLVFAGEVLVLPGASGSSAPQPTTTVVTLSPGENLTQLAARFGTSVSALAGANGIANPNLVFAGERIVIPASGMQLASYSAPIPAGGSLPPQLLAHPSRLALRPYFVQAASTYGVPASLLEAVCWWESGWQTNVVSSTGAIGICQIEPATATFVEHNLLSGRSVDLYSASGNIDVAAAYLHDLISRASGSESIALAGYYQGLQSVEQQGVLPTTKSYVTGILAYASIFAAS
jgi:LysM repeat protein